MSSAQLITEARNSYNCRLACQFLQIRKESIQIEKVYQQIYAKFNYAIDNMKYHPTSEDETTVKESRMKRDVGKLGSQHYRFERYIDTEEGQIVRDAIEIFEQKLRSKKTEPKRKK